MVCLPLEMAETLPTALSRPPPPSETVLHPNPPSPTKNRCFFFLTGATPPLRRTARCGARNFSPRYLHQHSAQFPPLPYRSYPLRLPFALRRFVFYLGPPLTKAFCHPIFLSFPSAVLPLISDFVRPLCPVPPPPPSPPTLFGHPPAPVGTCPHQNRHHTSQSASCCHFNRGTGIPPLPVQN